MHAGMEPRVTDRRYALVALALAGVVTCAGTGVAAPVGRAATRLVTGKDVRDGSLTSRDLGPGVGGPAGPAGPAGAAGQPGPAGTNGLFLDGPGGPG